METVAKAVENANMKEKRPAVEIAKLEENVSMKKVAKR